MTITAPDGKIAVVEYLRGIAALGVTWYHLTLPLSAGITHETGAIGWLGVDIFFVISGFVLPLSIWGRYGSAYQLSDFPNFLKRRIIRIEPPYLVSVALTAGLLVASSYAPGFAGTPYNLSTGQVLAHVLYLPRVLGYDWLQATYWTLALEFCFYIVIGFIFKPLIQHPRIVLLTLMVSVGAVSLLGLWEPRTLLFGTGMSMFLLRMRLIPARTAWFLALGFSSVAGINDHLITVAALITAYFISAHSEKSLAPKWHNFAMLVGAASYSLYITHVPIGGRLSNLGLRLADTELEIFVVSVASLLGALVFAWLFYLFIEKRFVRLSKPSKGQFRTDESADFGKYDHSDVAKGGT